MIGEMRHRLLLERPQRSDDGAGGADINWQAMGEAWASVEELAGAEAREAEQIGAVRRLRITLRWRADVEASWRLRLGPRRFEIVSLSRSGARGQWLSCDCFERIEP